MLITGNRRLRNFSRPVSSLSISGDVIPLVRSTVHLGICLSSTLSWSEHITRLIHRVQFKVFTLKLTSCPSPWFRKPCHTPLSKSRSPFSWVCCARMGFVFKTRCHVPWASAALGRPSYSSFKQAIMPQHGRSPDNRLANLSLASPTSKVASTLGPPSRQRSPKSERPSIPCIYPHSVLSPKPFVSCCSSLPYQCPSSEVFSSIYCDAFQFLAILCCLLFF